MYIKTKDKKFEQLTKFFLKIFAITFGIGVATGVVMEFEFGTNWAGYSRFVGDVFGSPLAAEAVFAFFLESTFLAILLFGWDKVKPRTHFIATILVAFGAHLSALWILIANSWMQTPAGFHIVGEGITQRAEIVDFFAMAFNPSTIDRYCHTVIGCWLTGSALVISIAAYYLLRKKYQNQMLSALKVGLAVFSIAACLQLVSGHSNAKMVAEHQPAKLAALEAHYTTGPGDLYLFGWVDNKEMKVYGMKLPGFLSFLIDWDFTTPVTGLEEFAPEDRPNVNVVFQSYHLMVMCGMFMIGIALLSGFLWWQKKLDAYPWYLALLTILFIFPQVANQTGWIAAEVGRQPWIVYNVLRTSEAFSPVVTGGELWASIILFTIIYIFLFFVGVYSALRYIKKGPEEVSGIYLNEKV
jgi:cytochrome d ubiquinol oxidase subunit I